MTILITRDTEQRPTSMSQERTLIDVKQALAEKYERLSRIAGSDPKRRQFATRARHYRRQLEQLKRES